MRWIKDGRATIGLSAVYTGWRAFPAAVREALGGERMVGAVPEDVKETR
jgi:hypothetical protein